MVELRTERLLLRRWRDTDLEPFARLNADPEVMRYYPAPLTQAESDALARRARTEISERGWGLWALEVVGGEAFIGFVGLAEPRFAAHFTPAVEVGWRLVRSHWGQGYATEAAREVIQFGFGELDLDEIVSFTSVINDRSRKVMERLGMRRDPGDDFEHPSVPAGPLRAHVLYRLSRPTTRREPVSAARANVRGAPYSP
jgi:RimJ/RimL family protein N-acetyltransferase